MRKPLLRDYLSSKVIVLLMALQLYYPFSTKSHAHTAFDEVKSSFVSSEYDGMKWRQMADVTVTGTVSDSNGEPIPGATVSLPGTTIGTATDLDGKYTLTVPEGSEIVFSFIGFDTKRIQIGDRSIINVTLMESTSSLEEVVVVGFGTQKRANVTGAVSTVAGEDLARRPVLNTASALQGTTPGLSIQNNGGAPGAESTSIRIRGVGTLNNSNPLVLVDGVEQSLSTVEPTNIETITVLKDAASSAIYGSRAANGVILVTTKRGAESGVSIN